MNSIHTPLRPLILNTMDLSGGAAIATYRLHRGLRALGVDSHMLVHRKSSTDNTVFGPEAAPAKALARLRSYLDKLPPALYRNRESQLFSASMVPGFIASRVAEIDPDIVHLSWITGGFLKLESLARLRKPLIWTLHDMWPFTGGCHYNNGCDKYREACGSCPVLHSSALSDLSRRVWNRKRSSWEYLQFTVVAPSRWLADCARSSSLFSGLRIEVLPNGIDERRFKPIPKREARLALGLPLDRQLIIFSAMNATSDPRKGFRFLLPALRQLANQGLGEVADLVVLGASQAESGMESGIRTHYLGHVSNESTQAIIYSAADVMVAPSTQENLSNSVMESMACGTPVVAFDIGGMPDLISHRISGWLAQPFDINDLSRGIDWVLGDRSRLSSLANAAREQVIAKYRLETIAQSYKALYEDVLKTMSFERQHTSVAVWR